ncbi:MAG TPA: hypothetical protein VNG51_19200 [Ktedonobacteraceae bacterium]|nr:hypothetical protein [Ktedonobacteraceae bacterium]
MSKTKALLYAGMWIGIAILFFWWQIPDLPIVCLFLACPFVMIAGYKYRRDWKLIEAAERAELNQPLTPALPMMSSPNSNRLFVPPPLDRRP